MPDRPDHEPRGEEAPAAEHAEHAEHAEICEMCEVRDRLRRLEKTLRLQLAGDEPWAAGAQRLRQLCDSHTFGLISWDVSGDILDANDAFLAMTGYSRDDLLTGRLCWQRVTPPEYLALDRSSAEELRRTGRCRPFEKEYVRSDGSRVPVLVGPELVDPERGLGISYVLDLTERKRYEERLLRQQLLESLGSVVAGTSHDFNNLLTVIVCNTSVALHRLPAGHPVRDNLHLIQQASQRATEICAQMQAYAIPDVHGSLLELDLGQLARDVCERARPMLATNVELDLDAVDRDIHVMAQPSQLEMVLFALLSNACEAMPNGGTITVSVGIGLPAPTASSLVANEAELANRYAVVSVRDTGVGMERETARHMFDPFFSSKFMGRGMGLAAAHGIVGAHGGLVEVETAPDNGTLVRILLPLLDSVH